MKFEVVTSPRVIAKSKTAATYLEEKREGYGVLFLNQYLECISYLEKHPHAQQLVKKQFRQLAIKGFKYLLIYTIQEKTVYLTNLVHTARHPRKRYRRK